MFLITKNWLFNNYGSKFSGQKEQTKNWLLKYGKNVKEIELDEWSNWKHLSEYQVNTVDIVPRCLDLIGKEYKSELESHRLINLMRVPLALSYEEGLSIVERKIGRGVNSVLELGVGGDSAISTAVFLSWLELRKGKLISVDRNPLGVTWDRYSKYVEFGLWEFYQTDSILFLSKANQKWDIIFIDTSHSFLSTYTEIELSSRLTNNILLDDATFEGNIDDSEPGGVKRAIEEWYNNNKNIWNIEFYHNGAVALLTKE